MIEWTLGGLFGASALLLIISIMKALKDSKAHHKEMDLVHISMMKEIGELKDAIRGLELDVEVVTKEAGIHLSTEERVFIREVLDLYRRNYSMDSIAEKKQVPVSEIEQVLAPFQKVKEERGTVVNEN